MSNGLDLATLALNRADSAIKAAADSEARMSEKLDTLEKHINTRFEDLKQHIADVLTARPAPRAPSTTLRDFAATGVRYVPHASIGLIALLSGLHLGQCERASSQPLPPPLPPIALPEAPPLPRERAPLPLPPASQSVLPGFGSTPP